MTTLWRVLFLAERYGRQTLTLDEVADQISLAAGTIRNRRTAGDPGKRYPARRSSRGRFL